MRHLFLVFVLATTAVAGCEPADTVTLSGPAARSVNNAGLPPPPGRAAAERQARRAYYGGPRGQEF